MANVAIANLIAAADNVDRNSYTTGSFTATSGRVLFIGLVIEKTATVGTATLSISGGGTVTEITNVTFSTIASPTRRLTVWRVVGASGSNTATFDLGGVTHRAAVWSVNEATNADTTTPIVGGNTQTAQDDSGDTNAPEGITFSAFGSSENRPLVFTASDDNQNITPNAGADTVWVELSDTIVATTANGLHVMWADATSDTTPTGTSGGAVRTAIIAVEVAAAVAGGASIVPVLLHQYRQRRN